MYTEAAMNAFVALAGERFTWAGVRGCSRPASDVRKALRDDLLARQGGICPVCGCEARNVEFNHLIARGPMVKGFVPGNVFAGCGACNASTKPLYDERGNLISGVEVITPDMLVRPDLVPSEWTPFPILRKRSK